MIGTILHVNVSAGGIPKRDVGQAYLAPTGLEGDSWAHPRFHGGPKKAILLITSEALAELAAQGFELYPGALGENFTTEGLDRHQIRSGDRFQAGAATIEITTLRVPCATLNVFNSDSNRPIQSALYDEQVKAGDASSPRWGLGGFYARVLRDGLVRSGDRISYIDSLS